MKNLHHKVTEKDLIAIFGQFQGNGEDPVLIRLMKGKMKGQAFIEFHSEFPFTPLHKGGLVWQQTLSIQSPHSQVCTLYVSTNV